MDLDLEIDTAYKMREEDWAPLIDAMEYLSHLPQCGDIAKDLRDIFIAAKEGKYYNLYIGWKEEEQCSIIAYADKMPLRSGEEISRRGNSDMKKIIAEQWTDFYGWKKRVVLLPVVSKILSIFKRGNP